MAVVARLVLQACWLGGACLFMACGDSLYDQKYRGDPVYSELRNTTWTADGDVDTNDLQMALFFNPGSPQSADSDSWIELVSSITPITDIPSRVTFNVFELPGADLLSHAADGSSRGYGTAQMLLYRDSNHDGQRNLDEPFMGSLPAWQFLYLPQPLPAARLPTDRALPAGFHRVFVPQTCGQPMPGPATPGDCGVPLGAKCASDQDCRGGFCLSNTKLPWRAGYCVIVEPPKNGCRPAAGVYLRKAKLSQAPAGAQGFYLRACNQDEDCVRPDDINQHLYSCDPGLGACTPTDLYTVNVGNSVGTEPFCGGGIFVPKS